jgi:hypothetical protein
MNALTPNQERVLLTLRARGAEFTANATERQWRAGERYYLDARNGAGKGILRAFEQGNREAEAAAAERIDRQ